MRGDRAHFRSAFVYTLVTLVPVGLGYAADSLLDWYGCFVNLGTKPEPCALPSNYVDRLASFVVVILLLSPFLLAPALVALRFWVLFAVSWWLDPGEGVI